MKSLLVGVALLWAPLAARAQGYEADFASAAEWELGGMWAVACGSYDAIVRYEAVKRLDRAGRSEAVAPALRRAVFATYEQESGRWP
jgi:hypothetical protein